MNAIMLFTLLIATSQANHLRQDATLFREPPQEAKVERPMEKANECTICQNIVAVMQNTIAKDQKLLRKTELQRFKTLARNACHGFHDSREERECLDIVDNPIDMMNHLYDLRPSTCEYMGHCKRCIPCTPPAECVICEPPDATDLGWMDLMSTSWKSFSEWFSVPYTHKKGYIWDNMNQGI